MATAWHGDWNKRIKQGVAKAGCASLTEFCNHYPTATFRELSELIDDDVAPIQIVRVLFSEAEINQNLTQFAQDSLVRYLHQRMPCGWGKGERSDYRAARAFASWSTSLGESYRDSVDRVWCRLSKSDLLDDGWLPIGVNDPIIVDAFQDISFDTQDDNARFSCRC